MSFHSSNSRSAEIRSEARKHLARLRAERRRERESAESNKDAASTITIAAPSFPPNTDESPVFEAPYHSNGTEHDPCFDENSAADAAAVDEQSFKTTIDPSQPDTGWNQPECSNELEDSGDGLRENKALLSEAESQIPNDPLASDLLTLPGAGPGLVWMLNNCGIASIADLASADAETLKADMGLVARILDVEFWIRFARENI